MNLKSDYFTFFLHMVRLISSVTPSVELAEGGGAPLYISVFSPGASDRDRVSIAQLRVDFAKYWDLKLVSIVSAPDATLVGRQFHQLTEALGELKKYMPSEIDTRSLLTAAQAYVVPEAESFETLCQRLGGGIAVRFQCGGEWVETHHAPQCVTDRVACLPNEPSGGGGGWVSVSLLLPIAPYLTTDDDNVQQEMQQLMRQVCSPQLFFRLWCQYAITTRAL